MTKKKTIKEAKLEALEMNKNRKYSYIYMDKQGSWVAAKEIQNNIDKYYMVHKSGKMLQREAYEKWVKTEQKRGNSYTFPFSDDIPEELYKIRY